MKIFVNGKCVFQAEYDVDEKIIGVSGSDSIYEAISKIGGGIVDAYIEANSSLVEECLHILHEFEKNNNIDGKHKLRLTSEEKKEIDKILIKKTAEYIQVYNYGSLYMAHLGYTFYKLFEK